MSTEGITSSRQAYEILREFALSLPGAYEDFPWGECAIKVNKITFAYFGDLTKIDERLHLGVKLVHSREYALDLPYVKPSNHAHVGKYIWANVYPPSGEPFPMDLMIEWIEESYRAVAPRKLLAQLDTTRVDNDLFYT